MNRKFSFALFFLLTAVLTTAGAANTLSIKKNAGKYDGRTVLLKGEITVLVKIPLTEISIYVFKDRKGSAIVLSAAKHQQNDKIILKGTVSAFPEKESKASLDKAVKTAENFFIKNNIMEAGKAEKAAIAAGKAIETLLKPLGGVYIITENM